MKRYKLVVTYDGTNYCGWQKQKNGVSVQEVLTNALAKIATGDVKVTGSGRTDSGVHARAQVVHVDMSTSVPGDKIAVAVNPLLPNDVSVVESREVDCTFHARYGAKEKTYVYRVYVSKVRLPLVDRYALRLDDMPDIKKMRKAAELFIGVHDFRCFMSTGSSVKDTVREIFQFDVSGVDEIVFKVTGNGFLYNMVRIMVGTLLEIGQGTRSIDDLRRAIDGEDRRFAGKTVPARGLTLDSVVYSE